MSDVEEIRSNLVYLTQNITNIPQILIHLIECQIISVSEMEYIKSVPVAMEQGMHLFLLIQKKSWDDIKPIFLDILRKTHNSHCADAIEGTHGSNVQSKLIKAKVLRSKLWPEEKENWKLVNSFLPRKIDNTLMTETLMVMLNKTEEKKFILRKVAVTGLAGIGKTIFAKWFASQYENNYEHLIFIKCDEENLVASFLELAKKLKVEIDVNQSRSLSPNYLSKECYDKLSELKCLWIFDDVENYSIIRSVLPSINYENFHSIITSRNRKWGDESGQGMIEQIFLEPFTEADCIPFLRDAIWNGNDCKRYELCELLKMLGGHPLAMQISVAGLNRNKTTLSIQDYIEVLQFDDDILVDDFDDYPKSINDTMTISLRLIAKEINQGRLAIDILGVFGFIRSSHIEKQFFEAIFKDKKEVNKSLKLLEVYSLVDELVVEGSSLSLSVSWSMHGLLQKVVRYNSRNKLNILKRILHCPGFCQYKLIPYKACIGEHPEIIPEFVNVGADLIKQLNLSDLLLKQRFEEATALARLIHSNFSTKDSAVYNLGICLFKNGKFQESLNIFEMLYNRLESESNVGKVQITLRLISSHEKSTRHEVSLWILYLHTQIGVENEIFTKKSVLGRLKKCQSIVIVGGELPIDIFWFEGLTNLELHNSTVLWNGQDPWKMVTYEINKLVLHEVVFVNNEGQEWKDIQFAELPFKMRDLEIVGFCSFSTVHVNLSKLPNNLKRVQLTNTEISFSRGEQTSPSILSLAITYPRNDINISEYACTCKNLISLDLFGFNLTLNFIPPSLKRLKLMYIKCAPSQTYRVRLHSLTMIEYLTVLEMNKMLDCISTENLIIRLSPTTFQQDLKFVIDWIDQSKLAIIGEFNTKGLLDLSSFSKYGTNEKSKHYKISSGSIGTCINRTEFETLEVSMVQGNPTNIQRMASKLSKISTKMSMTKKTPRDKSLEDIKRLQIQYSKHSNKTLDDDYMEAAAELDYGFGFGLELEKDDFEIDFSKLLGLGEFASIYGGRISNRDKAVVFKIARHDRLYELKSLVSELKVLLYVEKHENILECLGFYSKEINKGIFYIAMEFCEHGSLQTYLRLKKKCFLQCPILRSNDVDNTQEETKTPSSKRLDSDTSEYRLLPDLYSGTGEYRELDSDWSLSIEYLLKWSAEIANGMVVHMDIAARNILLTGDMVAKISDFGSSRRTYNYTEYVKTGREPMAWRWLALESVLYNTFSSKSDVWSYGVLLWEIFSLGEVPYPGMEFSMGFFKELEQGLRNIKPKYGSEELYTVMRQCWCPDPLERPTFTNLKLLFQNALTSGKGDVDSMVKIYNIRLKYFLSITGSTRIDDMKYQFYFKTFPNIIQNFYHVKNY